MQGYGGRSDEGAHMILDFFCCSVALSVFMTCVVCSYVLPKGAAYDQTSYLMRTQHRRHNDSPFDIIVINNNVYSPSKQADTESLLLLLLRLPSFHCVIDHNH